MKKYIERDGQTLKIEVSYNLGGENYSTSKNEKRGYYLSVSPVKLERSADGRFVTERYAAYSGMKVLIKEVVRKSQKAEREAEQLAEGRIEELISYVLAS